MVAEKAAAPRARSRWVLGAAFAGSILSGCQQPLKPDEVSLNAVSAAPVGTPDCASCHSFPLHDVNHYWHLHSMSTRSIVGGDRYRVERPTGLIVCMDCHFGSIAHHDYLFTDTTWGQNGLPNPAGVKNPGDVVMQVDTVPGFLPIPAGLPEDQVTPQTVNAALENAARIGSVVSWLTGKSHMNGQVDVQFNPNFVSNYFNDTTIAFRAYRAKDLSCSAIDCHTAPKKTYRWASKSLGLTGCPTIEHTPEIDSSCGYSPKQEPR